MANIDPFYYSMESLQQTIWAKDATGPLAGGVVTFYSDPAFSVLKDVFQESNYPNNPTFVNVGPVLTLSNIGSFVDGGGNNFIPTLYPWSIPEGQMGAPGEFQPYFITVYSADGILQFTVNGWPQNSFANTPASSSEVPDTQNIIVNPQFSEISFVPNPATGSALFTVSGTMSTPIAPGWVINSTGSGTITVQQLSLNTQTPGNAAYAINILFSAFVSGTLDQKIVNSPRILEGEFVSGYFEVASPAGIPLALQMAYIPSAGTSARICLGENTGINVYQVIDGTTPTTIQAINTDNADGYVTISISITAGANVSITNVQVTGVSESSSVPEFVQSPTGIQNSQLFYYWQPALNYKPIPSYLVGWDFKFNPCQELGTSFSTGSASSQYIADQTILFQTVASNFAIGRETFGLHIIPTAPSTFALIQYLEASDAVELLQQRMSAMIRGIIASGSINGTINLYWTTGSVPVLPLSIVTSVTAGPVTTVASGWTIVPKLNGPANFQLNTTFQSFGFNGFDATQVSNITNATYFAIVVSFDTAVASTAISLSSCSLVGGDIPTLPAPQTADEVLRECQYYYEKSYNNTELPGSNAPVNPILINTPGALTRVVFQPAGSRNIGNASIPKPAFTLQYFGVKRVSNPNATFYSYLGTANNVTFVGYNNGSVVSSSGNIAISNWTVSAGQKLVFAAPLPPGSSLYDLPQYSVTDPATVPTTLLTGFLEFQYVIDARLGVV